MSHVTSTFNMADVNVKQSHSFVATPALKSNTGDRKVCKKKALKWLFGADRKIRPLESLSGITRKSLVMPNSDPRTDFFYLHLTRMKYSYNLNALSSYLVLFTLGTSA